MQPIVMPAVTAFSTFSTRISRSIGTPHFITSPRRVNPFTFAAARAIVGGGPRPGPGIVVGKDITMRASVLFEQGKPLSVEDLELERPRAGEVRVRMAASGVCHSCLHAADGSWKGVPVPIVLGDEGAGVVEEV